MPPVGKGSIKPNLEGVNLNFVLTNAVGQNEKHQALILVLFADQLLIRVIAVADLYWYVRQNAKKLKKDNAGKIKDFIEKFA